MRVICRCLGAEVIGIRRCVVRGNASCNLDMRRWIDFSALRPVSIFSKVASGAAGVAHVCFAHRRWHTPRSTIAKSFCLDLCKSVPNISKTEAKVCETVVQTAQIHCNNLINIFDKRTTLPPARHRYTIMTVHPARPHSPGSHRLPPIAHHLPTTASRHRPGLLPTYLPTLGR